MNSVNIIGNMTRDPELRHTQNNSAVCNFGVAINEGKDRTTFVECTAWQATAEMIAKHFRKGNRIGITGRLSVDQWQDNDGNKRSKTFVTVERVYFCERKQDSNQNQDIPF